MTAPNTLPFAFYSFDTSAFINGQRDLYRRPTFEALWDRIGQMIDDRAVLAVDEVKREVRRKDDDVTSWVRDKGGLFVPLEHDIQRATKAVLAACPRLMAQHGANRNSADPFVVGLALARGGTVVTQETPANSERRPRIPDACIAVDIPWMTLPEFVAAQGWQFSIT